MKKYKKNLKIILLCLIVAFIFLLIGSKCSFLYPFQDWDDANTYFTVGKGLANGLMPFRDLFEQKGPIVYFMHAIAYLISNDTFHGVFIFEVLSLTFMLYYAYKTLLLFDIKKYKYLVIPMMAALMLSMYSFAYGDSTEEFMIPFLMFSLYHFVDIFKNNKLLDINNKTLILNGVAAGIILWIKFTMLGFFGAWMIVILFQLLKKKDYKRIIKYSFLYLLGMFIVSAPIIIYFYLNDALYDLFHVYFYYNIFMYQEDIGLIIKFGGLFSIFLIHSAKNLLFATIMFAGQLFLFKKHNYNLFYKILFTLFLLDVSLYFGGRFYYYYYLSFLPFGIFGIILIIKFLQSVNLKDKIIFPLFIIVCLAITYALNPNTYMLKYEKEDLIQYKFLNEIQKEKDQSLLNFAFLDGGFYTVSNQIPITKYFHQLNIDYEVFPDIMDTQLEIIENKKVNFVIVKILDKYKEENINVPELRDNYECIKNITQLNHYDGFAYRYLLYKRT